MKRLIPIMAFLLLLAGCDCQDSTENLIVITNQAEYDPSPDYDSDWATFAAGEIKTFTHNIGGDVDDYLVNTLANDSFGFGINQINHGGNTLNDGRVAGYRWENLTNTSILIRRLADDVNAVQIRVRIWDSGSSFSGSGCNCVDDESAYIFAHSHANMTLPGAGQWINATFNAEPTLIIQHFNHTYDDGTNTTITVQLPGTYKLNYRMSFSDAAANPTGHIVTRVVSNGIEINGSAAEIDTRKQYSDVDTTQAFLAELSASDALQVQWTSTATTVSLNNHGYYVTHPTSVTFTVQKID